MGYVINCPNCHGSGHSPVTASELTTTCWLCLGGGRLETYPIARQPDPEWERRKQDAQRV